MDRLVLLLVVILMIAIVDKEIVGDAAPIKETLQQAKLKELRNKLASLQVLIDSLNKKETVTPKTELITTTQSTTVAAKERNYDDKQQSIEQVHPDVASASIEDIYKGILQSLRPDEIEALKHVRAKLNSIKMALELQQYRQNAEQENHLPDVIDGTDSIRDDPGTIRDNPIGGQGQPLSRHLVENGRNQQVSSRLRLAALAELARKHGITLQDLVLALQQRAKQQAEREAAKTLTEQELLNLVAGGRNGDPR